MDRLRKRQYTTEEGLEWLERILRGESIPSLVRSFGPAGPKGNEPRLPQSANSAAYAIARSISAVAMGLKKQGKRLDLVVVEEKSDEPR